MLRPTHQPSPSARRLPEKECKCSAGSVRKKKGKKETKWFAHLPICKARSCWLRSLLVVPLRPDQSQFARQQLTCRECCLCPRCSHLYEPHPVVKPDYSRIHSGPGPSAMNQPTLQQGKATRLVRFNLDFNSNYISRLSRAPIWVITRSLIKTDEELHKNLLCASLYLFYLLCTRPVVN